MTLKPTPEQRRVLFACVLIGEVGELCNVTKKVHRGDFHNRPENASDNPEYNNTYAAAQYREEIGKEAADIVIYLDLLCSREGIDLGAAIVKKFNEVSDRIGSNIKINSQARIEKAS